MCSSLFIFSALIWIQSKKLRAKTNRRYGQGNGYPNSVYSDLGHHFNRFLKRIWQGIAEMNCSATPFA